MIHFLVEHGGRSSMAEHLIVVQAVEGSSPFVHPIRVDRNTCDRQVFVLACARVSVRVIVEIVG